jgi:hypothetical protein
MPRSGTTLLFGVAAAHSDFAWLSQHFRRAPQWPIVSVASRLADLSDIFRKSPEFSLERGPWTEILKFGPSESYPAWERCCGPKFLSDFLLRVRATDVERTATRALAGDVLLYQGKTRFGTKITGPARLAYLTSIFSDALFVHVIRDGRTVTESLMRQSFWRDTYRLTSPAWTGGLSEAELNQWREEFNSSPPGLAALQWRAVLRQARREAVEASIQGRYAEVRFEDFLTHPHNVLDEIVTFCGLPGDERPHRFLDKRVQLRAAKPVWKERFSAQEVSMLNDILGVELAELGYRRDGTVEPRGAPFLRRAVTGSGLAKSSAG